MWVTQPALHGSPGGPSHALQTGRPAACTDHVLNPRPAPLRSTCSGPEVSAASRSLSATLGGSTGLVPPRTGWQFGSLSLSVTGPSGHRGATPQPGESGQVARRPVRPCGLGAAGRTPSPRQAALTWMPRCARGGRRQPGRRAWSDGCVSATGPPRAQAALVFPRPLFAGLTREQGAGGGTTDSGLRPEALRARACAHVCARVCVWREGRGGERARQELVPVCTWHIRVSVWSAWLLRVHLYLCVCCVSG